MNRVTTARIVYCAVVLAIFALASYGYFTGRWKDQDMTSVFPSMCPLGQTYKAYRDDNRLAYGCQP